MWSEKKTRVDQRIVSLSQPHVRPIVRGKAAPPQPPRRRGGKGGLPLARVPYLNKQFKGTGSLSL